MTCNKCNKSNCNGGCSCGCNKTCNDMEVQELSELPIDNLESTVDFFLTERAVLDESTGKVLHTITRTPGNKIMPNGNLDNCFTLDPNNPDLEIVAGQPLPAYVSNNGATTSVLPADGKHSAQFFVIGKVGDLVLCQNTGVINVLGGHEYILSAQYYRGSDGEPTTDSSVTGQKLFIAISTTKLLINL